MNIIIMPVIRVIANTYLFFQLSDLFLKKMIPTPPKTGNRIATNKIHKGIFIPPSLAILSKIKYSKSYPDNC